MKNENLMIGCGIAVVGGLLLLFCGYLFCFVSIPAGNVGVKSWFGNVEEQTLEPGAHIVHPLKSVKKLNTQTQKNEEPAVVPTKNGLSVSLKATLLYHLDPPQAPKMVREVGGVDYEAKVIDPVFKNAVRDACAEFEPEALYTADRSKVEAKVLIQVEKELGRRGIIIESIMLLDPVLPDVVKARVEQKVAAEQDAQRMTYVLRQKELEAKAKVVEAEGIAKAQSIIKKDLTHEYLVYLWIEALKESAKNPHSTTIYVPTGGDGMPFMVPVGKGK